ncbi:MAG: S1 RNA-binding domain-containing protein [Waterburya sp.]
MNITFIQKSSARILIQIETNTVCLLIKTSCIFDPFEELYIWLGRVRDRQLPVQMIIDEEGYGVTLNARQYNDKKIEFTIEKWIFDNKVKAPIYIQNTIQAEELIQSFYDGITDFIKERYILSDSSFVVISNINWDSLLKKPVKIPNWKIRLAMCGGGRGKYLETEIETVQLTTEQQELYNLRNVLYHISKNVHNRVGVLADLYKNLPVDIALGEIDSDWYKKRQKEIDSEYEIYSNRRKRRREEQEKLSLLRKARLKTLKLGQLVDGTVVKFKSYGLFINICGINALLHISWVSQIPVEDLKQIFQYDGWVRAIITYLDLEKNRVGISTKELESQPGDMLKDPILVYQNAEKMAKKYRLDNNL